MRVQGRLSSRFDLHCRTDVRIVVGGDRGIPKKDRLVVPVGGVKLDPVTPCWHLVLHQRFELFTHRACDVGLRGLPNFF